ncbi:signal recognition particle 9 kDa protein-domain-containing protein [Xylariaceae sp. FL1019]|nr:signal recognition particle 9 kDa protein-domain-containing protein [Xylariaceae sp. FL1019]
MPTYKTSQEWLHQSSLLLDARPTTTRITTTYSLSNSHAKKRAARAAAAADPPTTPTPLPPRGVLVLKTYCPVSGACLKYRTTKAAEVSRMIMCLGQLGRKMAALPNDDVAMADVKEDEGTEVKTEKIEPGAKTEAKKESTPQPGGGGGSGGGGKGKKKKGKR